MSPWPHPSDQTFSLEPLRKYRAPDLLLQQRIAALREITPQRTGQELTAQDTVVDQLMERLLSAREKGWSWEDATNVRRRQWALLRLYTIYLGAAKTKEWLHPFDDGISKDILGEDGSKWHPSRRREVTQFFFLKFDRIQCLEHISNMLNLAWQTNTGNLQDPTAQIWAANSPILFQIRGPEMVADLLRPDEGVNEICERFFIPEDGRFRECLYEALLLGKLRQLPLDGTNDALFEQCEKEKSRVMRDGRTIGYRAVEILVKRSIAEGGGRIGENWSRQLVPLSGDPRSADMGSRQTWWGWATEEERRTAIRALTGLNIREFIRLLDESLTGTGNRHQFAKRRDFLMKLFDKGIIQDASVVIHDDLYEGLDQKTRNSLRPSRVRSGSRRASFICLECRNNVFLIEGTFNFALRVFLGRDRFPINNFWTAGPRNYLDEQFRISEVRCDIFQRHSGNWERTFISRLRNTAHIDWGLNSR